jgi:hypothetical protein
MNTYNSECVFVGQVSFIIPRCDDVLIDERSILGVVIGQESNCVIFI